MKSLSKDHTGTTLTGSKRPWRKFALFTNRNQKKTAFLEMFLMDL
jgi:hypothetical protein